MRILFDQATPVPIRAFLKGHHIRTASEEGWDRLSNGSLLDSAEAAGFDVFLTTDRNLQYQQNLRGRRLAIIVLSKQQWPDVRPHVHLVIDAVNAATAGSFTEIKIP